jgi:hypothetical protein
MIRINDIYDFDFQFINTFGDIDKETLSKVKNNKLRIELGGSGEDFERIERARIRSNKVLQYCFDHKELWLRIILWSENEEGNLKQAGFDINSASKVLKTKVNEEEILLVNFNRYSESLLTPITTSIINYEMAEEPSANITCYFISFNSKLIINIYDDRGLDIYSLKTDLLNDIKNEFNNWVI